MMRASIAGLFVAALMLPALALPSAAEEHERPHGDHRAEGWHGGEIRNFHEHDLERWRGGAWMHGMHDGRFGWWWQVGPTWYFYAAPVYPYPDPYMPPVAAAPGAPAQGGQFWYYCQEPPGYYPYVPQCNLPWEAVPPS
jgi:hypothetical protein